MVRYTHPNTMLVFRIQCWILKEPSTPLISYLVLDYE